MDLIKLLFILEGIAFIYFMYVARESYLDGRKARKQLKELQDERKPQH